jgi:hypothetical protein
MNLQKSILKYSLLVILSIVFSVIISAVTLKIYPNLLRFQRDDNLIVTLDSHYLRYLVQFIFNAIIVGLMYFDMKEKKITSFPVLILTLLSIKSGIIFYILLLMFKKYYKNEINI